MKNNTSISSVYFLGIGGIGMSALARYFLSIGKAVAGYDKTPSKITDDLQALGAAIHFEDATDAIPTSFLQKETTLVVVTPAVPKTHVALRYFQDHDFQVMKRAEVLGLITQHSTCLAVAGTHGKTTTSCLLAHILKETQTPITAFLGGISEDFNSNFLYTGAENSVVEADEFDRSFLHLSPNIACITSMDADHLDIYGTANALTDAFKEFAELVPKNGTLIVRYGLPIAGITYGINEGADYDVLNVRVVQGEYVFDVKTPTAFHSDISFGKPGRHNILNAIAAVTMAAQLAIPEADLLAALATFKGVQRRFVYHVKRKDLVLIDDYAHHPTEIAAVYSAVREMHPGKKITVVFQPHLFSRTKDFIQEFAAELKRFDNIVLLPIYPAREEPIEGVTSAWLAKTMGVDNVAVVTKENCIKELRSKPSEIIVTMGAGDIGILVNDIKNAYL